MSKVSIAIITPSLGNGGAERVSAYLTVMLDHLGYNVTVITAKNIVDYPFCGRHLPLNLDGNIDKKYFKKIKAFFKWIYIARSQSFDVIIDARARRFALRELLIELFVYPSKTKKIYMCHRSDLDIYIPKPRKFFVPVYKKVFQLVTVSNSIEKAIRKFDLHNVKTIYNALDFDDIDNKSSKRFTYEKPYLIAIGRLDENVKQFDHLIKAFSNSGLADLGFELRILGHGFLMDSLKELAEEMSCKDCIRFEGFVSNPYVYLKNAKFLVMSSKLEGFPMVLIESLACGTPVISYDCPTGPSEIIQHEKNGLLVENGSIVALTIAISRMYEDKILYKTCKENARKSVAHLSFDKIKDQWKQLIESAIL